MEGGGIFRGERALGWELWCWRTTLRRETREYGKLGIERIPGGGKEILETVELIEKEPDHTRKNGYDTLRLRWFDTLVGTGYDAQDPVVISKLNSIASSANSNWSSMDKSPARTFLWSDLASTTVSAHITYNCSPLRRSWLGQAAFVWGDCGRPEALAAV